MSLFTKLKYHAWKRIWERRGRLPIENISILMGYNGTGITPEIIFERIIKILDIKKTDKVLEIGCGAGGLAQHLDGRCNYTGIDYSSSLIKRCTYLFGGIKAYIAEANDLPFNDKYFDKVFAYGTFQYFPSKIYAYQALDEMKRVSSDSVFIGNLPEKSFIRWHLTFKKDDFKGEITPGFWNRDKFNVLIK